QTSSPATHFAVRLAHPHRSAEGYAPGVQRRRNKKPPGDCPAAETCLECGAGSSRQLSQYVLQDAADLEVFQLVEGIDARDQWNALQAAVGRDDLGDQPLARLEFAVQAADRHLLAAPEAERLPRDPLLEAQWDDAHADQVRAMDAFERLAHHGA